MLEQQTEVRERLAVTAEHEAARGLAIEPVRELGPARQAEAQGIEPVFQARPALRPAMHRQSGRLVDHQHQPVAMKHAREDFLLSRGLGIEHLLGRFHVHPETAITAASAPHPKFVIHCRTLWHELRMQKGH